MPLEILLAEDNPRDREFLVNALSAYRLTAAIDGEEAIALAQRLDEPLLISDVQMPLLNGIELATQLWRLRPNAKIIFWTQHKDEMYVRALTRIVPAETVYGYVLKNNPAPILVKAVENVFTENQCWVDPQVRPVQARLRQNRDSISDLEFEVLIDIALGLTDNMIAKRRYLSRRGAQSRLRSLYHKLGVGDECNEPALNPRARAVAVALQRGLINAFELEEEERKLKHWLSTSAADS